MTPTADTYLRTAVGAAQRMANLIDDLLQLSRLLRTEMHTGPVDLSKMMRELKLRFDRDGQKRSDNILVEPTPPVIADKGPIEIALQNLLSNALKFTTKTKRPRIEFGSEVTDEGRVFYIRDNGAGFDMAYAGKLFGVFQRLHNPEEYSGTGIGLATVQRILQRHNGRIWARGEVGTGATFSFTLPLA